MERHLENVSPPFGIYDQIGLCAGQFTEVGDSPRRQLQTLRMFSVASARALVMHTRPFPWSLDMATQSDLTGTTQGGRDSMLPGKSEINIFLI